MNEIVMNDPLYREFVSPDICQHLFIAGIKMNSPYSWRVKNNIAELNTFAFDTDGVYKQSIANIDSISAPDITLKAYQVVDMQKLLPDYFLSKRNGRFEISLEKMYSNITISDERMPDAIAKMVLECIRARIIDPANADKIVNSI